MSLSIKDIITLNQLFGVGSKLLYQVEKQRGETLLQRLSECHILIKENGRRIPIVQRHIAQAEQQAEWILQQSKAQNIHLLSYYDDNFPTQLKEITNEKGEPDHPFLLYYKGDLSALHYPCIAIVGTRHPSAQGEKASFYLAEQFAKEEMCIVSGLALGCDTYGHQGALNAGGRTIAFLAHGLDTIFPPENRKLAQNIIDNKGLLLSEYPIGTPFSKYNFISRDRLQAGLSLATVVIQTGTEGGTMHVAKATLKAGKPLYVCHFRDKATQNAAITQGNQLLVEHGAIYLKGSDDLHVIANTIKGSRQ
ncbi:MAG: DNA-protecting protein DprA [Paludibacteraceae bacterium]|nr:DNA-protecting protein DprA [Paludibacteraceae bacterium]